MISFIFCMSAQYNTTAALEQSVCAVWKLKLSQQWRGFCWLAFDEGDHAKFMQNVLDNKSATIPVIEHIFNLRVKIKSQNIAWLVSSCSGFVSPPPAMFPQTGFSRLAGLLSINTSVMQKMLCFVFAFGLLAFKAFLSLLVISGF